MQIMWLSRFCSFRRRSLKCYFLVFLRLVRSMNVHGNEFRISLFFRAYRYLFAIACILTMFTMLISFILGGYAVFNTELGSRELANPIRLFPLFIFGLPVSVNSSATLGDIFAGLWSMYIIIFVIAINGPKLSILGVLRRLRRTTFSFYDNTVFTVVMYFSIMLLAFSLIELIQKQIGIPTGGPPETTPIRNFTLLSLAPIVEEFGFRVTIIGGVVIFLLLGRISASSSLQVLWHPLGYLEKHQPLGPSEYRSTILFTIVVSGLFFGAAHLGYGTTWEIGKLTTATIAGILLGWIYFRQGFPAAILLHWCFNFYSGSYVYFSCALASPIETCEKAAESSLLVNNFELLLIITSILSIGMIFLNRRLNRSKWKQSELH